MIFKFNHSALKNVAKNFKYRSERTPELQSAHNPVSFRRSLEQKSKRSVAQLKPIFERQKIDHERFRSSLINFESLPNSKKTQDTLEAIREWYKNNGLELTTEEAQRLSQVAYYNERKMLEQAGSGPNPGGFMLDSEYQNIQKGKSSFVRRRLKRSLEQVKGFVSELNKLYQDGQSRWGHAYSIVNATPDTAYFIPMETPVIYNKLSGIPLGFSYDPSVSAYRVTYLITGDPMFSFIYDNPLSAVMSRAVHSKMIDWTLPPIEISKMYADWYGSPLVYEQVFNVLHNKMFGTGPRFWISVPGVTNPDTFYPDWRDQKDVRNRLLSSMGGFDSVQSLKDWDQSFRSKMTQSQKSNYWSLKEPYKSQFPDYWGTTYQSDLVYPKGEGFNPERNFTNGTNIESGITEYPKPKWLVNILKNI